MNNPNGYLSRSLLDELAKKQNEKKTTTQIADNWQRLTASQQAAQKKDAEMKHAQSTTTQKTKAETRMEPDSSSQKSSLGTYNAASVISLGKGPLSSAGVDRLVESGEATVETKNGQIYVSPKVIDYACCDQNDKKRQS